MRASYPFSCWASNLSLEQYDSETAMAKTGGKSGKGKKPGNVGVRGGGGSVGKRGLVEKMEIKGKVIGGGMALIREGGGGWEVLEELVKEGDFWTNEKIKIRCGKMGLEENGGEV